MVAVLVVLVKMAVGVVTGYIRGDDWLMRWLIVVGVMEGRW